MDSRNQRSRIGAADDDVLPAEGNVAELRPDLPTARVEEPHHSHHRRSKSRHSSRHKLKRTQVLAGVVICAFLGVLFLGWLYLYRIGQGYEQLDFELRKFEKQLAEAEQQVELLTAQRNELVAGRIPGLKALTYDHTVDIGEKYLRNILFTVTRSDGKMAYEYRVVMENASFGSVLPRVRVVLYDNLGIQVGEALIGRPDVPVEFAKDALAPEEIRTYSDVIVINREAEPHYFTLLID